MLKLVMPFIGVLIALFCSIFIAATPSVLLSVYVLPRLESHQFWTLFVSIFIPFSWIGVRISFRPFGTLKLLALAILCFAINETQIHAMNVKYGRQARVKSDSTGTGTQGALKE